MFCLILFWVSTAAGVFRFEAVLWALCLLSCVFVLFVMVECDCFRFGILYVSLFICFCVCLLYWISWLCSFVLLVRCYGCNGLLIVWFCVMFVDFDSDS